MKIFFSLLFLFLSLHSVTAQQSDSSTSAQNRFYIGVGLTTVSYHIYYKNPEVLEHAKAGYFTPVFANIGYRLGKRARIQLGLGYGGSSGQLDWSPGSRDTLLYHTSSRTYAVAAPVTMQFILFKALKRFPVYGTATVMPALGVTNAKTTETRNNITTTTLDAKDSGVNIFATAGAGFNYSISNRFDGYIECLFYKANITGRNSFYYDWEHGFSTFRRLYRSLGVGVNYSL